MYMVLSLSSDRRYEGAADGDVREHAVRSLPRANPSGTTRAERAFLTGWFKRDKSPPAEGPGLLSQGIQDQKNSGSKEQGPATFRHQECAPSPMLVVLWRAIIEKATRGIYTLEKEKIRLKIQKLGWQFMKKNTMTGV